VNGADDELYRDVILDHFKNPRNHGRLSPADIEVEGVNPLCGDQIRMTVKMAGDNVEQIRVEGKGCSISQSSASMMTEALKGKSAGRAQELVGDFKRMMLEKAAAAEDLPEDLEELAALEGVKKYPVRIKCAVLSWNTFLEGLRAFEEKRAPVVKKHSEE
jgi:nitrogen fixation protein NifU and related proteins